MKGYLHDREEHACTFLETSPVGKLVRLLWGRYCRGQAMVSPRLEALIQGIVWSPLASLGFRQGCYGMVWAPLAFLGFSQLFIYFFFKSLHCKVEDNLLTSDQAHLVFYTKVLDFVSFIVAEAHY